MALKDLLTKDQLHCLYHEEKLSIRKIAKKYNVTDMTVHNLMKNYQIPRRSQKEMKVSLSPNDLRLKISKEDLKELHYNQGLTQREIAKKYSVHYASICKLFKRYELKAISSGERRFRALNELTREDLNFYYIEMKMSTIEIAKTTGISHNSIIRALKHYKIRIRSKKEYSRLYHDKKLPFKLEFFKKPSKDLFYILGLWAADGNVSKNCCSIALKDKEVIEWIVNIIDYQLPIRERDLSKENPNYSISYSIGITHPDVVSIFAQYGVVKNKSLTIKFPTHIPSKYMSDFIRGVFDGDGSVSIGKERGQKVSIGGASKPFIQELSRTVGSYMKEEYKIGVSQKSRQSPYYTFQISDLNKIKQFVLWLYGDNLNNFGMERKKKKMIQLYNTNYVDRFGDIDLTLFETLTPKSTFLLGVIAAKGRIDHKRSKLTLRCSDEEKLKHVSNLLSYNNKIYQGNDNSKFISTMNAKLISLISPFLNPGNPIQPNLPERFMPYFIEGYNYLPRRFGFYVDKDELERLRPHYSNKQLAAHFCVSLSVIKSRLKTYGITKDSSI
ncbi:LAGLIDADG family homing endonuclease [Guptibacillus algicola]|uniref:LAGLIDADG family homing endonuclease n=1 Tax=Guptibacillus algicola TaxID=225844 RepID=UPI001CD2D3E2|nr:LAGLIDADG family homing endonuclease [Alkalihalobacillus algicola]MCA0987280.1 hypothetical protein [Alkalihalobacillus algicola]